jgi:hypothetical protein
VDDSHDGHLWHATGPAWRLNIRTKALEGEHTPARLDNNIFESVLNSGVVLSNSLLRSMIAPTGHRVYDITIATWNVSMRTPFRLSTDPGAILRHLIGSYLFSKSGYPKSRLPDLPYIPCVLVQSLPRSGCSCSCFVCGSLGANLVITGDDSSFLAHFYLLPLHGW